ncbi:sodium:solute symporter family protein [Janibacter cremeus]|uniref:Na+/proline symporter n=1 Tax=Janibacter cremeus TaxID=1285192 RepID=A0A852VM91_9MICO|nr:sodium:solute symporter family protein [Janibacter cremeus]NYF98142.1 Na+/proline symporter [Janibacter cremeus]
MPTEPPLGIVTVVVLLLLFYGLTMYMSVKISRGDKENADDYMTAGHGIGFGISAASMTATWIWASSMYASATSGYLYGISGPIHYGLWGALMILFIYPFGKRIRAVAPRAHTLAQVMAVRHGRSSQLMLAGSNVLGSVISLMSNFIAGGALIAMLSPLNFIQGVFAIAGGVLLYTIWSGFRASVLTDFAQVVAMLGAVVVLVPAFFFILGGVDLLREGSANLTPQQSNFFSSEAFLKQGAPYIAAVLAYAIGNQTIAQRLFAVREDLIKPTFITATIGYGATVIGVGMLGVLALYAGVDPAGGDPNNLLPQLAATHLATPLIVLFFVMIIGSLSSTADSDLAALSSIVMTDIYGQTARRSGRAVSPRTMLLIGRLTMVLATAAAVSFAALELSILDLLVFVGALWGCLVFPVIASFYWKKVTNSAFTVSVLLALVAFLPVRFGWLPRNTGMDLAVELLGIVGIGVVIGLMLFGFFGPRVGLAGGIIAALALAPFALGLIADYAALSGSLVAYAVSTLVCAGMTFASRGEPFDFDVIARRTGDFDPEDDEPSTTRSATDLDDERATV